ncbi:MAG: DNA polymerase III subunit beta [Gammaproteobacteria bacterium]|nr:DNA polymerase III subunit beta [Gammaproteobacteria bacterium]
MIFKTQRENILKPLQLVSGVVEKRQTMPILANVLLNLGPDGLRITATDLEMEVRAKSDIQVESSFSTTVPVRKLQDTIKTLPEESEISFEISGEKALLKSGRTKFTLTTMPAENFPVIETKNQIFRFSLPQSKLKQLIDKTQFAMALQDVRYYLNGLLFELQGHTITAVATDGHRLAMCQEEADIQAVEKISVIVPRKAVMELSRLLEDCEELAEVVIGENYIKTELKDVSFTSKLIDGQYPNYQAVIPREGETQMIGNRSDLRQCLIRTSILSNEKYRGIRIQLSENKLRALANNPEQEEAEDEIEVDYNGTEMEIGFNVNYLLDAITAIADEQVKISFADGNGSALITATGKQNCIYVVMPMRI